MTERERLKKAHTEELRLRGIAAEEGFSEVYAEHDHAGRVLARLLASTKPEQPASEGEDWPTILRVHIDGDRVEGERIPIPSTTEGEQKELLDGLTMSEFIEETNALASVWERYAKRAEHEEERTCCESAADYTRDAARMIALLAQPQKQREPKHGLRIVGDEDALLETCEGEPVEMESVGIYEDMPTPCPRCGDKLVLRMGHSVLYALPEPAGGEDE